MKAVVLLCDWAQEVNGKLYIMGGGWSRLSFQQPATMALAIKLYVPWDEANRPHDIAARLLTVDGDPVTQNDDVPVEVRGKLEVGRPPGLLRGSDIDAPLTMMFQNLDLAAGRYFWLVEVDEEEVDRVVFDVLR